MIPADTPKTDAKMMRDNRSPHMKSPKRKSLENAQSFSALGTSTSKTAKSCDSVFRLTSRSPRINQPTNFAYHTTTTGAGYGDAALTLEKVFDAGAMEISPGAQHIHYLIGTTSEFRMSSPSVTAMNFPETKVVYHGLSETVELENIHTSRPPPPFSQGSFLLIY